MGIKATAADLKAWGDKGLIPTGKPPPRPGKLPPDRPAKAVALVPRPLKWSVTFEVPTVLRSEPNVRQHWAVRDRRRKAQHEAVAFAWAAAGLLMWVPLYPCRVTVTRVGGKPMDAHDNLKAAGKAVVDKLAELMGLASDADPRVEWACEQRAGAKGVVVTIEAATQGVPT